MRGTMIPFPQIKLERLARCQRWTCKALIPGWRAFCWTCSAWLAASDEERGATP